MKISIVNFIFKVLALWFLVDFGKSGDISHYTVGMIFLWFFIFCRNTKVSGVKKSLYSLYMFYLAFNVAAMYFFFHYAFKPAWEHAEFLNSIALIILILNMGFSIVNFLFRAIRTSAN